MSETWGSLAKDQSTSTTIDQAIASAIVAHKADPTAHLGAGESLASHKASEIIDHTAGSIVPDKFSFIELPITTFFESITSWLTQGHVFGALNKLQVGVEGDDVQDAYAYLENVNFRADDLYFPYDNYVQIALNYNNFCDIADIYFGIGVLDVIPAGEYVLAFKIVGTTLYVGYSTGGAVTWESVGALSENVYHSFRIDTVQSTKIARFIVDGSIVKTVDLSALADWAYGNFGVFLNKTGGTLNSEQKYVFLKYFSFWAPIFV